MFLARQTVLSLKERSQFGECAAREVSWGGRGHGEGEKPQTRPECRIDRRTDG